MLRHGRHLLRRLPDRRRAACAETAERAVAGRPLSLPALDIHTVGAGGGSIAWRDAGGALRVGPGLGGRRARARPATGAAATGRRSPTPTSCSAGCWTTRRWPAALRARPRARPSGPSSAPRGRARPRRCWRARRGSCASPRPRCSARCALMTVERGIDPRGFALMPFGGAGPAARGRARARARDRAHALPARLRRAVRARPGRRGAAPRRRAHGHAAPARRSRRRAPRRRARALARAGRARRSASAPARVRVRHELRYRGQSFELPVEEELDRARRDGGSIPAALREAFARAHEQRYGYRDDGGGGRAGQHPRLGVGRRAGARPARRGRRQRRARGHAPDRASTARRSRRRPASASPRPAATL